jgi:signal transduction histidine kinase
MASVNRLNPPEAAHHRDSEDFESLLAEFSTSFARATSDQIHSEVDRWVTRFALFLQMDRASIALLNPEDDCLYVTHRWSREGVTPVPAETNISRLLPWCSSRLLSGETIVFSHADELPPEASTDIRWARTIGFKSNVMIPVRSEDSIIGAFGFGAILNHRNWSPAILRRLHLVANVFGSALERRRSVNEIYRLREELRQASRIAMMGELTATLAHELNQPLGAILHNAQAARMFLDAKKPNLAEVRDALDAIVSDDARASEIIRQARSQFHRGQAEVSRLDLRELLHSVERIVRTDAMSRGVSLSTRVAAESIDIVGNRTQLIQAVMNLVLNAFDSICESPDGPRQVDVLAAPAHDGWVRVTVRDSGTGIDPKLLPRLFNAFVTTKPHGMGMGLAIARSIIESHGGTLRAAQNVGRGATLEFTLPTEPAPAGNRKRELGEAP